MNTKLLLKVKEQILKEPKQFSMDSFFSTEHDIECRTDWMEVIQIPNCGTIACIAGWAIALTCNVNPKEARDLPLDAEAEAELQLELDGPSSRRLFYLSRWPQDFIIAYNKAKTPEEMAKVAADRIDHFIATEGAE